MIKSMLLAVSLLLPLGAFTFEREVKTDNDRVRVSKIVIMPQELVDMHRFDYERLVVPIKGGTLTCIEEDGSTRDLSFTTGESVFLPADPPGQQHATFNPSSEQLEFLVIEFKKGRG